MSTFHLLNSEIVDNYVILDNADLFDTKNGVRSYPFQGPLKPLVMSGRGLVNGLLLPVISGKLSTITRGEMFHVFVIL